MAELLLTYEGDSLKSESIDRIRRAIGAYAVEPVDPTKYDDVTTDDELSVVDPKLINRVIKWEPLPVDTDWRDLALCLDQHVDMFYPPRGGTVAGAMLICAGCPVKNWCLSDALERDERHGVWGGVTAEGRADIIKSIAVDKPDFPAIKQKLMEYRATKVSRSRQSYGSARSKYGGAGFEITARGDEDA